MNSSLNQLMISKYDKRVSYRRKMLDFLQDKYKGLYKGIVLDIGGRDRGNFRKPKENVERWIFADINPKHNPDMIIDVADMKQIESESIDIINAIELFEHVKKIKKGLRECFRVLKEKGTLIISAPFLAHIHGDPYDFQRWTSTKWKFELGKVGFKIEKFIVMGRYFSNLAQDLKELFRAIERNYRGGSLFIRIFSSLLDKIQLFDNKKLGKNDPILRNFHNGYFIIARK